MGRYKRFVREVSIFSDLDEGSLDRLESLLTLRSYSKDALIVSHDESGDALFIVVSGRAKAVLRGNSGREVILYLFRQGDFFGEMSLLDNQPRSASVEACEDTSLLVLRREAFLHHIERYPQTALSVLREMSRRLRYADEIIGSLALLDVYARVARMLRDMGERDGEETEEGVLIPDRPTQQDMAGMIGASRETVSRALSDLARRGYIELSGKNVLLRHAFLMGGDIARLR